MWEDIQLEDRIGEFIMKKLMKCMDGVISIDIDIPGVYHMGNTSGQGKTYLCTMLNEIKADNISIITYCADVKRTIEDLNRFIESGNEILIIDTFDKIICPEIVGILKQLTDRYIILDYKNGFYDKELNPVYLIMTWNEKGFYLYARNSI
jgi:hypothetical protein